jgi:DNA mismatch repair ATPase MutS
MLAAVFVCLFINPVAGIALIIASVTFSIITYYRDKAEVEPYFVCVTQIVRMVETAEKIAEKNYSALADYNESLKKLSGEFTSVTKNVWLLESGSVNGSLAEMLLDYVRMLTHVDLIKFNHVVRHIGDRQKQVYELMDTLGFLEACMCVSSFRESLDYWVRPEFTTGHSMQLEEAYHPLVENPVCNSITADRHVLLTGSNASGKSTFLRTVAINALLSQTINTSLSKRYRAPFYRIYSSMSLKDDLSSSNSYYIVEIKSLKRILDAVDDSAPVLMFVDEVLRGTNTVERIAASSEILRSLKNKNALCFAATHDIELTTLLKDCYDNYHFQEEVTDSDVKFNFKLFKGPATTRNAIKLLQIIGYDSKIIQSAESQAGYFLENGSWRV